MIDYMPQGSQPNFASGGPRRRGPIGHLVRLLMLLGLLWIAGLALFAFQVIDSNHPAERPADGIVALTGGPDRINDAAELLAAGRARKLLITGVNSAVTDDALIRQSPALAAKFRCCVDVDHRALNTAGNAEQARIWAEKQGYRSLIVVTSSYHIPRAMIEFRREMPGFDLQPYSATPEKQAAPESWRDLARWRLLVSEYWKLPLAWIRARLISR